MSERSTELWREQRTLIPWIEREGSALADLPRKWSAGFIALWVVAMIPVLWSGDTITCHDSCPVQGWVDVVFTAFLPILLLTLIGLFLHRPWASGASAVAAALGLTLSTTDLHAPAWAIFELATFGVLLLLSAVLGAAWRRTYRRREDGLR